MTIRRQLILSFLVLLFLFGLNLLIYFVSNRVRDTAILNLTEALSRQTQISPIQNQLNNLKKHTILLSQIHAPTTPLKLDEFGFLIGQLETIKKNVENLSDPVDPDRRIEHNTLVRDYRELSRHWRFFYENFGTRHADAIFVLATQADPLSQRLSASLVTLLEAEKERARVATIRLEEVTRRTHIITLFLFGLSLFLAVGLALNLSRYLTQRFKELMEGTALIGRGDLSHRITIKSPDELGQLARSFNEMTDNLALTQTRLIQVNKELEAFNAAVSHDLLWPLRQLNSVYDTLLKDYSNQLDEGGKTYLRLMRSSAKRMEEVVEGLLSLSRATRYELQPEPVPLADIARSIVERLKSSQPDRNTLFIIEEGSEGLLVQGDKRLLMIALETLLNNAWKFTGKKKDAQIFLGTRLLNGQKTFFVSDNGAGFDMKYISKLFGPFERLHNSREFEGHGIGLVTVKRIIERHGGRIWAEGEVNKGATFYFTLESATEQPPPLVTESGRERP